MPSCLALQEKSMIFSIFVAVCIAVSHCVTPPAGHSLGAPWPMPKSYQPTSQAQYIEPNGFTFTTAGQNCDILEDAITRYHNIIFNMGSSADISLRFQPRRHPKLRDMGHLSTLSIDIADACDKALPSLEMDESYNLNVGTGSGKLSSKSIWGALRGLETFSQIVYEDDTGGYMVNATVIDDAPRFSHRGMLLDTSRHFLRKEVILQNLDAMAYNKFNVFHWHIVDDQSFPYQSPTFPGLSDKGAYDPYTHVYTQEDIKEIIEYARLRGIRVVPEFDSPGHSQSWGKSQPGLLTLCYRGGKPIWEYGPIDPTVNTTYTFLRAFMKELTQVFPDKYLHLGGDEVSFGCWESNPKVQDWMKMKNFTNYAKLEEYYMQNLLDIVSSYNSGYIIWQEVVDNGVTVRPDTVVEVWKGGEAAEMARVTKLGHRAILASCWYLNYISYGKDWTKYYACDPQNFNGTDAQKALVIGGETTMWGEFVDGTNYISRMWPRAGAVGERLWSPATQTDANEATPRMEENRCRLIRRGLPAEPVNGPGYCRHEYIPRG